MDIGVYIQSLIHIIVLYALWTLFVSILAEYVVVLCLVCATTQLIDELDALFPQQLVFNALGVVYPPPHTRCKRVRGVFRGTPRYVEGFLLS